MENKNAQIKAYKGFDKDLKCRGFQYEIGKTYHCDGHIELCNNGFHAIHENTNPLSVFNYYPPAESRYCEVLIGGETDNGNGKIVGSDITIGEEIGVDGLVKAHEEWVRHNLIADEKHNVINIGKSDSTVSNMGAHSSVCSIGYQSSASNTGDCSSASNMGDLSTASNTGYQSSASNTGGYSSASNTGIFSTSINKGPRSSASNTGNKSASCNTGHGSSASNTGDYSSAINAGYQSSASNTGDFSSASNTGGRSSSSNTGDCSSARNMGNQSAAINTGYQSLASTTGKQSSACNTGKKSSAEVSGKDSVAIVTGKDCKVRGSLGCAIVVAERGEWNGETFPLIGIYSAIVDGVNIKADTWYTAKNGQLVEVSEMEE